MSNDFNNVREAIIVFMGLVTLFIAGLAVGNVLWADPGRCDEIVGGASSIVRGGVAEMTVTCVVERRDVP